LRPKSEDASDITGNSSDFAKTDELVKFLQTHPENVLHLTKLHLVEEGLEQNSQEYFDKIGKFAESLRNSDKLIYEDEESLFIYRQWIHGVPHTGVVGLVDILDYQNNRIRRHENTRSDRERFIAELFDQTKLIAQPVLMGHKHHSGLHGLLKGVMENNMPFLDYEKSDRKHEVWKIVDKELISELQEIIKSKSALYIMDGHHRIATVSRLYNEHRDEAHRYLPAFLLDDEQLQIDPFHRLIESAGLSQDALLKELEKNFEIRKLVGNMHPPRMKTFCLITNGEAYELYYNGTEAFELDVNLIENVVLRDVFGIRDSRLDERISFIKGDEGLEQAIEVSRQKNAHLFLLYPCTFQQICNVSDRGEVMPPKSTSVEPKCRMGVVMYRYGK